MENKEHQVIVIGKGNSVDSKAIEALKEQGIEVVHKPDFKEPALSNHKIEIPDLEPIAKKISLFKKNTGKSKYF